MALFSAPFILDSFTSVSMPLSLIVWIFHWVQPIVFTTQKTSFSTDCSIISTTLSLTKYAEGQFMRMSFWGLKKVSGHVQFLVYYWLWLLSSIIVSNSFLQKGQGYFAETGFLNNDSKHVFSLCAWSYVDVTNGITPYLK